MRDCQGYLRIRWLRKRPKISLAFLYTNAIELLRGNQKHFYGIHLGAARSETGM